MFRYFIYNTYLRFNFHSRFHFGAVFVGPDGLMQPPFHIFTIVKHNVFLMTTSSPFAFSPKEVLWPLRFPWYQKQVTKALEEKKINTIMPRQSPRCFFYRIADRAVKPCRSSRSTTHGGMVKSPLTLAKQGNKQTQTPQTKTSKTKHKHNQTNQRQVSGEG